MSANDNPFSPHASVHSADDEDIEFGIGSQPSGCGFGQAVPVDDRGRYLYDQEWSPLRNRTPENLDRALAFGESIRAERQAHYDSLVVSFLLCSFC
jgi:hypothetical protein